MKRLIKKLFMSVLLHCMYVFLYLQVAITAQYCMDCKIDWWILWVILFELNLGVQGIVYKIYKNKPLENEKHKDIYMWINGLFIIWEVYLMLL